MLLVLQILFRILLCSVIIIAAQIIISKKQKPRTEIITTELGERFIEWKNFSIIYMITGIGFADIFIFALSVPSNLNKANQGIVIGFFVSLILLLLLLSFLYGRVYVKIGKEKIYWRKMNGKENEIRYEDISSYKIDESGNINLYQGDKSILNFSTGIHRVFVTEVLKNHKIEERDWTDERLILKNNTTIIMKMGRGYVIFDAVCIIIFGIFFLMSAYYGVTSGVIFFFVGTIGAVFNFVGRTTRRIIVENKTIIEKGMLKKQKTIKFGEVSYLSLEKKNNTEVICVHSNTGISIKIPKFYQNVEMFEAIISKHHWKWK